ncbi:MAG: cupin domain-containing protein [Deltaproteobacteria bacterium]|nr:cupin domain-containing protein [Deltaproteobacteria bacterium]
MDMENLGERIREERRIRKLTLEKLSQKTGLSKSFLSQVERGLAQPSVSSLKKIALHFGISVVNLFTNGTKVHNNMGHFPSLGAQRINESSCIEDVKVVRGDRRKTLSLPGSRVSYELITPDLNRQIEVLFLRLTPGESSGNEPIIDPPGEKCCLILKGNLEYRVGEKMHQLRAGDSIYHPAHLPHAWRGTGDESIEVIVVLTPPWF